MAYQPHDHYFKKAKQQGYRSRAAYKLIELQERYRLIKAGDKLVDLGAAPGGWLQVAAKIVGPSGMVIGVDIQTIQPLAERNIRLVTGDITSNEVQRQMTELLGGPANCVLSDLAPKLSGIRDADTARCLELNRTALTVALTLLRPGGALLVKSFISDDLPIFTGELRHYFSTVQRTKPEATRQGSSEFYFYAKDFRPNRSAAPLP
jgi:23S rRNA (uridine2552-2'-O)-methyltransferase